MSHGDDKSRSVRHHPIGKRRKDERRSSPRSGRSEGCSSRIGGMGSIKSGVRSLGSSSDLPDSSKVGWAPIPGRLHPAVGVDEVEAKEKYGICPARTTPIPMDDDGFKSDIYFCDKATYRILNDALKHRRDTELSGWVAYRLRIGALFAHYNYDQVPGWRLVTEFGEPKVMCPNRAKRVIPEWLKLHGVQDDSECAESAQLYAEASSGHADVLSSSLTTVFMCGNTKLFELLCKDYAGVQKLLLQRWAVDKDSQVTWRVWHVTSQSSSQHEEVCLNDSDRSFSFQGPGWESLRTKVPGYFDPEALSKALKGMKADPAAVSRVLKRLGL